MQAEDVPTAESTNLGTQGGFREHVAGEPLKRQTITGEPQKVEVSIGQLRITDKGVWINGAEVKCVTGVSLTWCVDEFLWRFKVEAFAGDGVRQ